ncbi:MULTISPECIES: 3-mercaptopyruvate sulfurtransferase [Rhodomicrobium]|uniref:3-mercaptopyruvate sulfurtransferase n=1 Tax=Rhodomicrobium TaxID=1068 RepID=UPI000B4B92E0|nr:MULTISPECIES: 3-mercaptopyruvate sulfurtransferase [Rhodomicrobium]
MAAPAQLLVETDWLAEHLDAPGIVILDASFHLPGSGRDAAAEFRDAHIPGAVFFDIEEISDSSSPLPHMLPPPEKFASRVRKMGIGDGMRIVIYDSTNMSGAARAWWMFRVMGAKDVVVLNGGLAKWRAEDRTLQSGEARRRTERHFTARVNSGLVRDINDMTQLLDSRAMQIVDARAAARFAGTGVEPRPVPRLGHIPGSRNVPFTSLLSENGTLRSPEEIAEIFAASGVDVSKPVVASCGSGVTACVLALGLARVGNETAAVYDGSWVEWSESDRPIETGS